MVDRRALARGPALTGPAHREIFETPIKNKYKNMKCRFYKNYNTVSLIPTIQFVYETLLGSKKLLFLDIDFVWLNVGISFTVLEYKPKNK